MKLCLHQFHILSYELRLEAKLNLVSLEALYASGRKFDIRSKNNYIKLLLEHMHIGE